MDGGGGRSRSRPAGGAKRLIVHEESEQNRVVALCFWWDQNFILTRNFLFRLIFSSRKWMEIRVEADENGGGLGFDPLGPCGLSGWS